VSPRGGHPGGGRLRRHQGCVPPGPESGHPPSCTRRRADRIR